VHHWDDLARGLAEMLRVARRRLVIATWDRSWEPFWLMREYLPEVAARDIARFRPLEEFTSVLGDVRLLELPVPADCTDGFLGAFWCRPEAYLDARVRAGISTFGIVGEAVLAPGLRRLADDLASGAWDERFGHLRRLQELDIGIRLLVHDR